MNKSLTYGPQCITIDSLPAVVSSSIRSTEVNTVSAGSEVLRRRRAMGSVVHD